ncbi:tetratricopeptide repeat protein [Aquabacter cavernae]|uniref:tetratricopeptide repeat protein n=1 Tax=Aquabacter cavernae TaxID=2496029 RepID=UPI001FE1A3C9|nr:tetratricopeptide repeat protein [Aquabacter cavernae]
MTDIFHEIEEDLRRERFRRLWDRYGLYLILLCVAIVGAAGAWSGYRYWTQTQSEASGARFEAANRLIADGNVKDAETALDALSKDGTTGYRVLARFRDAGLLGRTDRAAAVAAYDALATDASVGATGQDVARIRASLLLVDTAPLAEMVQRMQPLADGTGPMRHSARQILALAHFKAGDLKAAGAVAQSILDDPETPPAIRSQGQLIRTLTAAAEAASAP